MLLSFLAGRPPAVSALGALVLGGCSLAFDTAQTQCDTADDCAARGLEGACVDNVCVGADGPGSTGLGGGSTATVTSSTATTTTGASGGGGAGGAADEKWGCLGEVVWPTPDPETNVTLKVRFQSASSSDPPPDLSVRYCAALDVSCATPIAVDIPVDEEGRLEVEVPGGTRGFFEVEGPTIRPGLLYFAQPAGPESTLETLAVTLITESEYSLLVATTQFETNPERGTLLTVSIDCQAAPAAGVRIASSKDDEEATSFYFVGLLPDPDATQTDVNGYGGIFNMPVGAATVEAFVAADDRWIGVSSFQIRPGWLTNVSIEPTPTE